MAQDRFPAKNSKTPDLESTASLAAPLLDAHDLDAVLAVLLVGQDQERHALGLAVLQHVLEHQAALVQAARLVVVYVAVADVGAVDDEDDGVGRGVVALPQPAQRELAAHVPELDVHVRERDGRHVLPDRGHRVELGLWPVRHEEGLYLLVEGGLAGIVEAEEDHRVFCVWEQRVEPLG
ncbi:hypothetical protein VSDG_09013 [Cytospora chrysosperma]|uniref:Uncharacterized protein n=1 Tax=Cytospora chrysosperma TaxID=252740 RepID=A0A423VBF4_CYTCH|nr:hypothetical protein VSDG_09013 [Valsa sordida]